jgi:hypothetical protein
MKIPVLELRSNRSKDLLCKRTYFFLESKSKVMATSVIRNGINWLISFTRWGTTGPQNGPHQELPRVVLKRVATFIDDPITLQNFGQSCRLFADIVRELQQSDVEVIISTRMEDYLGSDSDTDRYTDRYTDQYEFEPINIQEKKPLLPESRHFTPGPVPGSRHFTPGKKKEWWLWTSQRQLNSNWPLGQLTYLK